MRHLQTKKLILYYKEPTYVVCERLEWHLDIVGEGPERNTSTEDRTTVFLCGRINIFREKCILKT